ncbi:hypothetical protein LINPERPRIM_LOCUS200, partial [Linum perenne]
MVYYKYLQSQACSSSILNNQHCRYLVICSSLFESIVSSVIIQ